MTGIVFYFKKIVFMWRFPPVLEIRASPVFSDKIRPRAEAEGERLKGTGMSGDGRCGDAPGTSRAPLCLIIPDIRSVFAG
jgi:hypothetical protein